MDSPYPVRHAKSSPNVRRLKATVAPWCVGVLAFFHLILVVLAAFGVTPDFGPGIAGKLIRFYASCTGADSGYGFFAPNVPDQTVAHIISTEADGRMIAEQFDAAQRTTSLRIASLMSVFRRVDLPELQAKLIAAHTFGSRPSAREVQVFIGYYRVPSIREFREGKEPEFEMRYEGTFVADQATTVE